MLRMLDRFLIENLKRYIIRHSDNVNSVNVIPNNVRSLNFASAGTVFRSQKLTFVDGRFCRIRRSPSLKEFRYVIMAVYNHNIGIQINWKDLTKSLMMISN